MQLSAKNLNACLATLELARRYSNPQPVGLKTIANEQNLSPQFLVQIFLQLKRSGLVQSTRGASGGYRLTKHPSEISLLDIISAMDGAIPERRNSTTTQSPAAVVFFDAWNDAAEQHRQRLSEITLASLVSSLESHTQDMYYI